MYDIYIQKKRRRRRRRRRRRKRRGAKDMYNTYILFFC